MDVQRACRGIAAGLFFVVAAVWSGEDLAKLCTDQQLFRSTALSFARDHGKTARFTWTSKNKTSLRAVGEGMRFKGLPVVEVLVRFRHGRLSSVALSLYNRGDREMLPEDEFDALVEKAAAVLTELTGEDPKSRRSTGATDKDSFLWVRHGVLFRLDYKDGKVRVDGRRRYRSEYVRLSVLPFNEDRGLSNLDIVKDAVGKRELRGRVVTTRQEDMLIRGVPMVDQGRKGYCACAATARILQYFGRRVDQHEIAQIANTGKLGTSPQELLEALKRIRGKFRISVKTETMLDVDDVRRIVRDYNRLARRADKAAIKLPRRGPIQLNRTFAAMDLELLQAARMKRSSVVSDFEEAIRENIEDGLPLAWSVILGLVEERNLPQASGGHMRLIIGYNAKTKEVVYTDSWGRGHEQKRMSLGQAMTITTGLFVIKPR